MRPESSVATRSKRSRSAARTDSVSPTVHEGGDGASIIGGSEKVRREDTSLSDGIRAAMSLEAIYRSIGRTISSLLADWDDKVSEFVGDYVAYTPEAEVTEIVLAPAVFLFDLTCERVVLAYGLSAPKLMKRDVARMRGFPDVNVSVRATLGDEAFIADRGHFLGHASGGELDVNLFPHRRGLNRGWSAEGKRFREMEAFVASHQGTFFYHRPIYDDETWIPAELEYGVQRNDSEWWVETFQNKTVEIPTVQ